MAQATAGLLTSATAQAKTVAQTPYLRKIRKKRQMPARPPYSKNDSVARSRRSGRNDDGDSPSISRRPMPSWSRFSAGSPTLFVVDHEGDRHPGIMWPAHARRGGAVANEGWVL